MSNQIDEAIANGYGEDKACVTCGEDGHTYVVCPKKNIFQALTEALYE